MNTIKLDFQAKLLLFAFVVSPFTLLRLGFLGLGEIIFLISFLYVISKKINKKDLKKFYITKFWLIFLFISTLGTGYNVIFSEYQTSTYEGILYDFASYVMLLFSSFLLEYIIIVNKVNTYLFLKYVFFSLSVILSSLYIMSFYTHTLFGFPLVYVHHFAPLVKNVHQISMMIPPLVFIGIKIFREEKGFLLRAFILVLIALDVNMALDTGSTKAMLGLLVGSAIFVGMIPLVKYEKTIKYMILLGISILSISFIIQTNLVELLMRGFVEADQSGARAYLYSQVISAGEDSLLIGHGTGQHVKSFYGHFSDAHQTYITIFLQAGLIGLFFFIALTLRMTNNIINHPSLLAALSAIMIYASGGDILRRLPIWVILIFLFHYSVQDEPNKRKNFKIKGN